MKTVVISVFIGYNVPNCIQVGILVPYILVSCRIMFSYLMSDCSNLKHENLLYIV